MEEQFEPNLFQLFREEGPVGLLVIVASVTCTLWLLISRIRGCFRLQPTRIPRDLALLMTGPVTATLYSVIKALVAVQAYVRGGIDSDFVLIYGLQGPKAICIVALLGFLLSVIAFTLPSKSEAKVA
ncbi:hypothetical protein [Chthoniobacter flavus]|nr:hypothetical protein [Chthoniobacter flavus]